MRKKRENDTLPERKSVLTDEERALAGARRKFLKKQKRMRKWTAILCGILAVYLAIGTVGLVTIKIMTSDMPELNVNDFVGEESSRIYDADGNLLVELGTYYRENVSYDKLPESLVDAFLSIEDSRFFSHNGFDIPRFAAAAISNVRSGDLTGQGGSTFTMQLVKNSYFSVDAGDDSTSYSAGHGIRYKIQQIILSMQLEQKLDKKEVFELYVNRLNFGQNIRGAEMASRYYFGKSCTELNLSESALLAGIVNLPNQYNPYYYLDYATERRNEVLYMMLYHGYITEEEYNLAVSINVEDQLVGETTDIVEHNSKYQEYIDVVVQEAIEMTGFDPVIKGMDIYTAMDPDIQDKIIDIEAGNTSVQYADDLMQSAIVTMDHSNGEIVGIGGGRNYSSSGGSRLLNRATDSYHQPGSTVKPIIPYALGFEYLGFSIDEQVIDMKYSYPGETRTINNYDGRYLGIMSIKDAVADSRNIPAIMTLEKVTDKIGKEKVVDYMESLGFDSVNDDNYWYWVAIGANEFTVTVEQLAGAHAAIMNLGVYNEPHTIRSVVMTNGDTYYPENQNQRVLSAGSAYLAVSLMQNNVSQTKYFNYAYILRRSWPVYAKTGTTDWDAAGLQYGIPNGSARDEWMVSSNSKYTNAVWTGYDMAIAGQNTYFAQWKLSMNIAGKINSELIDVEAAITDEAKQAVAEPTDDLVKTSYVQGTWPHVNAGRAAGSTVTTTVSKSGLANTPQVNSMSDSYRVTTKGYVKGSNTVYSEGLNNDDKDKEKEETEAEENTQQQQPKPTPTPTPEPTPAPTPTPPQQPSTGGETGDSGTTGGGNGSGSDGGNNGGGTGEETPSTPTPTPDNGTPQAEQTNTNPVTPAPPASPTTGV